jgi:Domain of unknown function (DUF4384)
MNNKSLTMATIFAMTLLPVCTWGGQIEATGEYKYGPDTSDAQACRLAILAAKNNALLKKVGEDVSIDQSYACTENSDQGVKMPGQGLCTLNKYLWSQISGEIQSFEVMGTVISSEVGARTCRAKIAATIQAKDASDPQLDFGVTVNANTLRVGEKLKISVSTAQSANLNVFSWTPSATDDGVVEKIFPNQYQTKSFLNAQLTIPNQDYDIVVGSNSKAEGRNQDSVQLEHLIFVMSKDDLQWPQKMSYDDFSKKVFSTNSKDIRIRKKTLSVVPN